MSTPELTVLVLAGGDLQNKRLGPAPPQHHHPMLLPAGSGLAVDAILRFYRQSPRAIALKVLVDQPPPLAVPLRHHKAMGIEAIPPQPSILGTLKVGLATVQTPWVLINPITTLPSRRPELASQIQVGDQPLIRDNWSAVRQTNHGRWLFEHKADPPSLVASLPFTGILIARTEQLTQLVDHLPQSASQDLLHLAEALYQQADAAVVPTAWHDLGHSATHAASRRSRLPSRAFNQLSHCRKRDVIVKRSSDNSRLAAERAYLEALPQTLRRHFPALLPGGPSEAVALVMEAVPFPSLAELHLHWDLGPNTWLAILERLAAIQADLAAAAPTRTGNSCWLYSAKLASRWQQFTANHLAAGSDAPWWQQKLCINGRWFPPLEQQVAQLLLALAPIEAHSELQLIHGDFCFNNILCDPLYTAIRLIDPRGEAAPSGDLPPGYGDSRYDVVKLFHSVGGHYDAIVNNLFSLRWNSAKEIDLQVYVPAHQPFLANAFQELLRPADLSEQQLNLLTASLFFSMLPLHSEDSDRQVALAISGMLLLERASA